MVENQSRLSLFLLICLIGGMHKENVLMQQYITICKKEKPNSLRQPPASTLVGYNWPKYFKYTRETDELFLVYINMELIIY